MTKKQLEIDFGEAVDDSTGYDLWRCERNELRRKIAAKWNLPIGRKVRLKLHDIDGDFDGILGIDEYPKDIHSTKKPLKLRLGSMTFYSSEIESCVAVSSG
jgi:hypothetical protein